jgi:hypothetical protein
MSVPPLVRVDDAQQEGELTRESACFHFDQVPAP